MSLESFFRKKNKNLNIKIIETGKKYDDGGRLKRMKKYVGKETFMMTYGDGIANIDIQKLLNFHKKNKKLVTMTAVSLLRDLVHLKLKATK